MQTKATVVGLISCVLIFCGEINAQTSPDKVSEEKTIQEKVGAEKTIPGDVTFEVPIKLTRLSPYLSKVAVTCKFGLRGELDQGLSNRVEIPVSAGQIDTTVRVVIAVPATSRFKPGQSLNYECTLSALSLDPKAGSGWQPLSQKAINTSLQVSPTPVPITGTFTW